MKPQIMRITVVGLVVVVFGPSSLPARAHGSSEPLSYAIVGTGQAQCHDNHRQIDPPQPGQPFYGQDAQNKGYQPSYTLSKDGRTVQDNVTGLTRQQSADTNGDGVLDHTDKLTWKEAEALPAKLNAEKFGGFNDWRRPTIKELYSLILFSGLDPSGPGTTNAQLPPFIDTNYFKFVYGDTTGSAAIDPVFSCTAITNEGGQTDCPFYWTSTTHASVFGGSNAVYVAFGRAPGWMSGQPGRGGARGSGVGNPGAGDDQFTDVHGAGAQRSDPKDGNPADFPHGRGPQGDVIRINNYVRLVAHHI